MKNFKNIKEEIFKESYKQKNIFQKDDYIMNVNNGEKGKIIRSGVNYIIALTENNEIFRAWIKDIRKINFVENINKERKNIFFTNGKTETNDTNPS